MGVCTSKANRCEQKEFCNTVYYNNNTDSKDNIIDDDHVINIIGDQIKNADYNILSDNDILLSPTLSVTVTDDDTITEIIEESIDETIYEIPEFKNNIQMTIGDTVELISKYNNLHGIIRFIGTIDNLEGIFYGIELNKHLNNDDVIHWRNLSNKTNNIPSNQNNGKINNKLYFNSNNNGLFVRKTQINRILKVNYDIPRITINDEIPINQYKCKKGIIQYIGKPTGLQFENDSNIYEIYYGIKLYNQYKNLIYLNCSNFRHFIIPSRYDLLINGYCNLNCYIPLGIINLINKYNNNINIRCIEIRNNIMNNNIYKKYEPFDINDNICGPSISITKTGTNTHCGYSEVKICGYYQFRKDWFLDTGDFIQKFVKKTEYQIFKLDNGSIERIFRSIECDNQNPLLVDYKSVQMRWRHDIYRNNVHHCDHNQIFKHISQLYGLEMKQMENELNKYGIQLHGLNMNQ